MSQLHRVRGHGQAQGTQKPPLLQDPLPAMSKNACGGGTGDAPREASP